MVATLESTHQTKGKCSPKQVIKIDSASDALFTLAQLPITDLHGPKGHNVCAGLFGIVEPFYQTEDIGSVVDDKVFAVISKQLDKKP